MSRLSEYASDPVGYCKRRGGPRDAKAVKYGTKAHDNLVARRHPLRTILVLAVVAAIAWVLLR